ncbi:RNA methyltransferase [Sneathiella chinensis]|uniref:tRNA (cytidine/uridine-2'-O-)-methyltransferase TrmJ n=1 Tax=Sneathiella chinensis TaxID=349750 RepID=A0ABQ5U798_9PROT|nr:RNA methyltransferase [Sneathiella chinensis]GLQ07030.1 tRNA (cytidine/uridine-2'-O-)-methyltransferase TrmJ [Sneathiella chinensis]
MTTAEQMPAIILVEPQMGENIGAAARAMLNFGLTEMRIVNPRDGWPNERAVAMASRADEVLDNARLFSSVEEAIADLKKVYATTARPRDMIKHVATPKGAAQELRSLSAAGEKAGILFGKESWGLSSEHVTLADTIITVPLNPDFSSINLGQAVLLVAYEWFQSEDDTADMVIRNSERLANKEELAHLFNRIEGELDARGYFEPIMARKPVILRNMRNMFQRFGLMESDIRAFQGIVKGLCLPRRGEQDKD